MAENKCPMCGNVAEVKSESISEWASRWDDSQWNSREFRQFVVSLLREGEDAQKKLNALEPLYEEQERNIKYLERQLDLLQKTLDIAEKFSRPIILPGDSEVIK